MSEDETNEIKHYVDELFKDNKSPLTSFGTSWKQLVQLEKNLRKQNDNLPENS
jgi:hypothetical protein